MKILRKTLAMVILATILGSLTYFITLILTDHQTATSYALPITILGLFLGLISDINKEE